MVDSIANRNPDAPRGPAAMEELQHAYRRFFDDPLGNLVLVDLLGYSGWQQVLDASVAGALGLAEHNGKRIVFARIFHMMQLTPSELDELAQAARREQIANAQGVL
jgi:hypothetical protein